jgi:two-component sensor histidine kinase
LSLQSRATDDARLTTAFEESQHRILSMAGIHEHLYRSKDLSRVDMGAYIRELADELEHSYGTPAVAIQSEADEILLDIDRAIPCGLIVNELVSNALKHAFPLQDHQVGEIHISMHSVPGQDGQIELVVCDNGVGLPVDVEVAEAKTLGLTMVNLLSRQLRAELEVHRNQGTSVRITFSI